MEETVEITTTLESAQPQSETDVLEQPPIEQVQNDEAAREKYIDSLMQFATSSEQERQDFKIPEHKVIAEDNTDISLGDTDSNQNETSSANPFAQFGFNTADELMADYNALKEKANNPITAQFEYPDEHSKQIADAIINKNYKALKEYAETQILVSEMDSMSEDAKLKRYIQMQNPRFDRELIEDEFNKAYALNEEQYEDDPIELRKAKIRLEQKRDNDLAKANEFFASQAKQAQLPSISVPASKSQTDEEYQSHLASIAQMVKYQTEVIEPAINSLTEDNLKMLIELNDPNNQIDFKVNIKPSKSHLDAAKQKAIAWDDYLKSTVYDSNGNFLADKAALLVLKNENFDEYVKSVARQAVNAERRSKVNERRNVGFRTENAGNFVNEQMEYVDKMMQQRLS